MSAGTIVYIDGLNFYYGAVKRTRYKWLNFEAFCRSLLPGDDIVKIRYFTAKVSSRPHDPDAPNRQQALLDALSTLDLVEITLGSFALRQKWRVLYIPTTDSDGEWSDPPLSPHLRDAIEAEYAESDETPKVRTLTPEEKGSDVSLGAFLVADAYSGLMDRAAVLTNDSDLVTPIKLAMERGVTVDVFNPSGLDKASRALREAASSQRPIDSSHLKDSQFDDSVELPNGRSVSRPTDW